MPSRVISSIRAAVITTRPLWRRSPRSRIGTSWSINNRRVLRNDIHNTPLDTWTILATLTRRVHGGSMPGIRLGPHNVGIEHQLSSTVFTPESPGDLTWELLLPDLIDAAS